MDVSVVPNGSIVFSEVYSLSVAAAAPLAHYSTVLLGPEHKQTGTQGHTLPTAI